MGDSSEPTDEYALKPGTTVAELQRRSQEVWQEMKTPGSLAHARAVEAGYDPATLPPSISGVLNIRPSGAGLDPATLSVIIGAAGTAAATVAHDLWKRVLLPRIEDRWGKGYVTRTNAAAKKAAASAKTPAKRAGKRAKGE